MSRARRRSLIGGGACIALLITAMLSLHGGPAAAQTLEQALALAYRNNPTLLARRAQLRASDEEVSLARAGWHPTIQLEADAGVAAVKTTIERGESTAETTTKRDGSTAGAALSVVGHLYQGGRVSAETESAESRVDAGRARLREVEQTVMLGAVTAYMDVLRHRSELELNRSNERVMRRQLEAARDRHEVGEVTRTDVAQAEARLAQAIADRVAAEGNLISSRGVYRQVIGTLPGALSWPAFPGGVPGSEQDALMIASEANPAIGAAAASARAARADIDAVFSAWLPRLSVRGSYGGRSDQTSAVEEITTASLTATLTVPLYQTGAEQARVRQAKQIATQRRLEIDQARRAVIEEVTRAWEALATARARIAAFESRVRASAIALEGVEHEALVGLRTTLDVLNAEQELFEARVNLVRARRDEIVSAYRVKSTIGELTASRLGLPVELYDVEDYDGDVRDTWFGSED